MRTLSEGMRSITVRMCYRVRTIEIRWTMGTNERPRTMRGRCRLCEGIEVAGLRAGGLRYRRFDSPVRFRLICRHEVPIGAYGGAYVGVPEFLRYQCRAYTRP